MSVAEAVHPEPPPTSGGLATLMFMGTPAFPVEYWTEGETFFVHTLELDLVAAAPSRDEAATKIGHMILDLFDSLTEEEDLTDSEHENLHLILERVISPLVQYHRRRRRQRVKRELRRILHRDIDWRMGQASTHAGSAQGLPA